MAIHLITNEGVHKKINFLVPSNLCDYKTELMEFKKTHNWV